MLYRMLNPKKMKRCGHVIQAVPWGELSIPRLNTWFKVPKTVETPGLRKMRSRDVIAVTELLKSFLKKFEVALEADEHFVKHFILPKAGLVDSYVVEDLETNEITDFCSFLIHNVAVENDPKCSELKCVVLFYYAACKTSLLKLMKDLLVVAKEDGADLFMAYDVMGNGSVLDRLLFRPRVNGDEKMIYYYFYNYRLTEGVEPHELGLIL